MNIFLPFQPKLLETLKDYSRASFRRDFVAGLNVMVMAFPLSVAFAIASGAKPEQGLFSAILCGAIIAALGGSRVQIGGPTVAVGVVLAASLARARVILGLPPEPEVDPLQRERQKLDAARRELADALARASAALQASPDGPDGLDGGRSGATPGDDSKTSKRPSTP